MRIVTLVTLSGKKIELIALSSTAQTAAAKNVHAHIDVCTPPGGWSRAIEVLPALPVLARVQPQGLKRILQAVTRVIISKSILTVVVVYTI
jgi:hypothetical protein